MCSVFKTFALWRISPSDFCVRVRTRLWRFKLLEYGMTIGFLITMIITLWIVLHIYIHIFHANKQILMLWGTFAEMIRYFSLKAILMPTFPIPAQKKKRAISQRWKNEKLYKESSDLVSKFLTSKYINQSHFNFFLLHVLYVDRICI